MEIWPFYSLDPILDRNEGILEAPRPMWLTYFYNPKIHLKGKACLKLYSYICIQLFSEPFKHFQHTNTLPSFRISFVSNSTKTMIWTVVVETFAFTTNTFILTFVEICQIIKINLVINYPAYGMLFRCLYNVDVSHRNVKMTFCVAFWFQSVYPDTDWNQKALSRGHKFDFEIIL